MRSYKTAFIFASALALLADAKTVVADVWNPPSQREYESGNGKYLFRVTPDPQFWKPPLKLGACHGALYIRTNGRLTLQWQRNLINNVAPIFALVSNSGKYVVTISEWHDYEVLPVAIYGKCGLLINVFGRLEQIAPHLPIRGSLSGRDWLENSLFFYGPRDETFLVRLSTKQVLLFETETGAQIDDKWKEDRSFSPDKMRMYEEMQAGVKRLILAEALKLSTSKSPEDRKEGNLVLNQYRDPESMALLRQIAGRKNETGGGKDKGRTE